MRSRLHQRLSDLEAKTNPPDELITVRWKDGTIVGTITAKAGILPRITGAPA